MVRIGISVEGTTEERFVQKVLAPYLESKGIYVTPFNMMGDVKLDRIKSELQRISYNFDFVTTFYDFYGFRGKEDGETKSSLEERIRNHAHRSIKDKLIPYVQMYEFEGLLFSCPESIEHEIGRQGIQDWAQGVLDKFGNDPESINNSVETSPSKRLEKNSEYRKTTHGPNIAAKIGVERIRSMCHGFNEWLMRLEEKAG
ncbi:MAG: DUF4276 family protein [Gammaproteobacteria bacterium]|nr:MAG: DUF4276 family protein [Gammaproteobacteria bacterium]